MGLFDTIKTALTGAEPAPAEQTLPTLDEIHERILKADFNFKMVVKEAETAAQRSQAIYAKVFEATPQERMRLLKEKKAQDDIVKRKNGQAQAFAQSKEALQDVEIVMQIDEAFVQCGLLDANAAKSGTIESVQKSLAEASVAVSKTMEAVRNLGMGIEVPRTLGSQTGEDSELAELFERFDKASDPAEKEELHRKIDEKMATPQVALG